MSLYEKIGIVLAVLVSTVVAIGAMWWLWTLVFWLAENYK